MGQRRVVVVGAGMAGAAAAFFLAREHGAQVILLERERQPGMHATGRNAAILRCAIPDPALHALAQASARFYAAPPPGFAAHPLFDRRGIFLAAAGRAAAEAAAWLGDPACAGAAREVAVARLHAAWPALAGGVERCWFAEADGVLDVHGILHGFLAAARAHGAELRTVATAVDLLRDAAGAVRGVRVVGAGAPLPEAIEADAVVLAGGGWAAEPAAAAGFPLPLQPRRRHLLVVEAPPDLRADAPVAWILGDEFYFRPESGGLLMSPCDETPVAPRDGERADASALEEAAHKAQRWLPSLADAPVRRAWAAMRTFAPDGRFVLGPDPRADGLYWSAAYGGHGISCGAEAGRIAAAWAAGAPPPSAVARLLLPDRLLSGPAARTAPAAASLPA